MKSEAQVSKKVTARDEHVKLKVEQAKQRQERIQEQLAIKAEIEKKREEERLAKAVSKMQQVEKARKIANDNKYYIREQKDYYRSLAEIRADQKEKQKMVQKKIT